MTTIDIGTGDPELSGEDWQDCEYCGEEFHIRKLARDHIVPRSWAEADFGDLLRLLAHEGDLTEAKKRVEQLAVLGWQYFIYWDETNIVHACQPCNSSKGDRLPDDEFLLEAVSQELGFDIAATGFAAKRGLWKPPNWEIGQLAKKIFASEEEPDEAEMMAALDRIEAEWEAESE